MASSSLAQVQREKEFTRTADIVNTFVISTTQFLNRFAALCDTKLFETHRSLRRLEVLTILLEKKLKSVDEEDGDGEPNASIISPNAISSTSNIANGSNGAGLFAITDRNVPPPMPGLHAPRARQPPPPPHHSGPPPPPGAALRGKPAKSTNSLATAGSAAQKMEMPPPPPLPPPIPLLGGFVMAAHPRLRIFFEMRALRVPVEAIKAKMVADGYQPDWLDTPDAPAPTGIPLDDKVTYDSE